MKKKEPISLRLKKISNGNFSIFLDSHINGKRSREYLRLYIIPETDKASREKNKQTLKVANAIKAQRLLDYANGKAGLHTDRSDKILLSDWLKYYGEKKKKYGQSKSNATTVNNTRLHLIKYKGDKITMKQVDRAFCSGFLLYLANAMTIGKEKNRKPAEHKPKPMAKSTARLYYNTFVTALNEAVRDDVILFNPTDKLKKEEKKPIKTAANSRPYLEVEELEVLINTPCLRDTVKAAFLFACFCGLRYSDIVSLKWKEIKNVSGKSTIQKIQVKTHQEITVPLSKNALQWLPERNNATDEAFVFDLPRYEVVNHHVKQWGKKAGLSKDVTFHVARHTFATTLLTQGADIYTTSTLLGHQNLRTTQIYAEVVNKKKIDAVNLLDNIF